jgi:hypothetical protein
MCNVAFLFKQHLTDKIFHVFLFDQSNKKKYDYRKHFKDKSLIFCCLDRDILIGSTTGNGSDGCGSTEKLNINGTNSSNSSGSSKKKKCKRRHR